MIKQNRLEWITPALRVASRGEILYFAGCLPYFELFFSDLNVQLIEIAIDTVSLLNKIGVEPVVLPDERCCGHDLIWTGDEESFNRLRRLNLQSFHRAGVKTIITACGECSHVLKHLYPNATDSFPFEVMHLSEFLEKNGFPSGKEKGLAATYQDPCRLGRFQQVYEAPRRLLGSVLELREMRHYGRGAWCCGNSSWLSCDRYSKQMQVERLREAKETGSDLLVTACPKCYIHLSCAMRDINRLYDFQFRIQDLASVMSESIDGNSSTEAASSRTGTGKPASYSFNEY